MFGIDIGDLDAGELVDPAAAGSLDAATGLDLSALFGGFDPTEISDEFATLFEDLSTALVSGLTNSMLDIF